METRCSSYNPTDTSFSKSEFQVLEHTKAKNDAGCRYIPLTPTALDIIEQARHINKTYGYATDDFIFCTKEGRITSRQVTYRLKKCCKKTKITSYIFKENITNILNDTTQINKISNSMLEIASK